MITIKLSEKIPTILTFDGKVLECFFDAGGSRRIHIAHIKSIQLDPPDNKDKRLLTIQQKFDPALLWVDEAIVPQVNELIAAVKQAQASPQI